MIKNEIRFEFIVSSLVNSTALMLVRHMLLLHKKRNEIEGLYEHGPRIIRIGQICREQHLDSAMRRAHAVKNPDNLL